MFDNLLLRNLELSLFSKKLYCCPFETDRKVNLKAKCTSVDNGALYMALYTRLVFARSLLHLFNDEGAISARVVSAHTT